MREGELIVPLLVSLGMMTLMLRAFTLAQATQHAQSAMPVRVKGDGPLLRRRSFDSCATVTVLRPALSGDEQRAMHIAEKVRTVLEKYKDHTLALADGYKMDLLKTPQQYCQFTNHWFGFKAGFDFDPEHPTSLLYEKTPTGDYKLVGAMFTAPARFSEDQLNERIPLSVAQWRRHATFGWMTVVYPFENDLNAMWRAERSAEKAA